MIKKIGLVLLIFMLCGCEGVYNLKIDEDYSYSQDLTIKEFNNFCVANEFDQYMNANYSNDTGIIFSKINENFSTYDLFAKSDGNNIKDLNNNDLILDNFGKLEIDNANKKIVFNPDKTKCESLFYNGDGNNSESKSKLIVNVEFPFKVIKSNYTYSNENIYSWELDEESCSESIYIYYNNISVTEYFIYIFLAILFVFTVMFFIIKSKKVNEI